jgi:hypothetical protein
MAGLVARLGVFAAGGLFFFLMEVGNLGLAAIFPSLLQG